MCNKEQRLSWVLSQSYLQGSLDKKRCTAHGGRYEPRGSQIGSRCFNLLRMAKSRGTPVEKMQLETWWHELREEVRGHSLGFKVGIGVGVSAFVVLLVAALVYAKRRSRRVEEPVTCEKPDLQAISSANANSKMEVEETIGVEGHELASQAVFEARGRPILEMPVERIEAGNLFELDSTAGSSSLRHNKRSNQT